MMDKHKKADNAPKTDGKMYQIPQLAEDERILIVAKVDPGLDPDSMHRMLLKLNHIVLTAPGALLYVNDKFEVIRLKPSQVLVTK